MIPQSAASIARTAVAIYAATASRHAAAANPLGSAPPPARRHVRGALRWPLPAGDGQRRRPPAARGVCVVPLHFPRHPRARCVHRRASPEQRPSLSAKGLPPRTSAQTPRSLFQRLLQFGAGVDPAKRISTVEEFPGVRRKHRPGLSLDLHV